MDFVLHSLFQFFNQYFFTLMEIQLCFVYEHKAMEPYCTQYMLVIALKLDPDALRYLASWPCIGDIVAS